MTEKIVELIRQFVPMSSRSREWDFLMVGPGRHQGWHQIEDDFRVLIIADPRFRADRDGRILSPDSGGGEPVAGAQHARAGRFRPRQPGPRQLRGQHGGKSPGEFLRSFYYDTCVYDPQVLRVLLERVGADRLVMGSDYPVGEKDPVGWLRLAGVSGDDLQAITGGNAAMLLGLVPGPGVPPAST